MQTVFSRKNVLFSGIMDKQNVTLTSLAENQEKLLKLIKGLQQNDKVMSEAIQEVGKSVFKETLELIEEDRARIARLERYVKARKTRRAGAKEDLKM